MSDSARLSQKVARTILHLDPPHIPTTPTSLVPRLRTPPRRLRRRPTGHVEILQRIRVVGPPTQYAPLLLLFKFLPHLRVHCST